MCKSCAPGVSLLTHAITSKLDFTNHRRNPSPIEKPIAKTETTIFKNGTVLTMKNNDFSPAEALVVRGDIILYAGDLGQAQEAAGPGAKVVDLKNGCILPGFIEPHLHLSTSTMVASFYIDVSPTKVKVIDDAINILQTQLNENGPNMGGWIVAFGYDPSRVENHPKLTIQQLNLISSSVPIMVVNQSGHIAYVNSLALERCGVLDDTKDEQYVRDPVTEELTGEIFENAVFNMAASVEPPPLDKIVEAAHYVMQGWAKKGCTTVFDAGIGTGGDNDIELFEAITKDICPLRIFGALVSTLKVFLTKSKPPHQIGRIQSNYIKFWTDGSTQGFTAKLLEPYLSVEGGTSVEGEITGNLNYEDEETLYNAIRPFFENGYSILVHANGDGAIEQALNVYKSLMETYPHIKHEGMHRIDHFTLANQDQIKRARELGLAVSHTMGHINYWGETFSEYVLGPERAARIHPLQSDIDAGLIISLHSDAPVVEVDPLMYVRTAVMREMYPSNEVLGGGERISLLEAIKAVTINVAKTIGVEETTGSLEVGKKADFIILDKDPRSLESTDLRLLTSLEIQQTWLEGQKTWSL